MLAEDRGGELASNMDELLNTPSSSIVADQRWLRVPSYATTAGRREAGEGTAKSREGNDTSILYHYFVS
jgi:hypothetical protein